MTRTEQEERAAVVQEALSWQGTPYHHLGRVKGAGVDCGQLLAAVFEAAGLTPNIDPGEYPRDWNLHRGDERYLGIVETYAHRIEGPPQPGDILLYKWGRCINHGAIVVEWPLVIHSFVDQGVILDDAAANSGLASRLVGIWSCWGGR
jgi:cell wall-associated NlpC family hydrolase